MLSKFTVSNYKTFETTVSIVFDQPGNYSYHKECIHNGLVAKAVIIGKNASGKFNLGKAILDIKQVLRGDKGEAPGNPGERFFNANSDLPAASFDYEFIIASSKIGYSYKKDASQ